jgi:hypothetical protein
MAADEVESMGRDPGLRDITVEDMQGLDELPNA